MLSELYIERYRGINDLKLENLGMINIIAGENNTGKTSILEVIESLEAPNSLIAWRFIARREGSASRVSTTVYDTMKSIFPFNCQGNKKSIIYYGKNNEDVFKIELIAEFQDTILTNEQIDEINGYKRAYMKENIEEYELYEYEATRLKINYRINNKNCGTDNIYSVQKNFSIKPHEGRKIIDNVVYVSPTQHAQNTLYLDALMTDSNLYEQFVEIMKEFDSDFISINSVEDEKTHSKKYIILSKKFKEGLLLNAYGDGMKKAMLLLSALLKAKNGILLLDEFETAIHVSVMGKVFQWLMETAVKLNVQIFMTSHSIEAISTVLKCRGQLQDNIRMITLVNTKDGVKVRNVDAKTAVRLMEEYGLELR